MRSSKSSSRSIIVVILSTLLFLRIMVDGSEFVLFGQFKFTDFFAFVFISLYLLTVIGFPSRLAISSALLALVLFLSTVTSSLGIGNEGRTEILRTLGVFGAFLAGCRATKEKDFWFFISALKLASSICALVAIFQWISGQGGVEVSSSIRYPGLMAGANNAAIIYSIAIVAQLVLSENSSLWRKRLVLSLNFLGLGLSLSLGGMLFLGVSFVIWSPFNSKKGKFQRFAISSILIIAIPTLTYFNVSNFRSKITTSVFPVLEGNADARSSLQWRFESWTIYWQLGLEKPLFGQGYGTARNLSLNGLFMPHNELLRLFVEIGVVGLLTFLFLYINSLIRLSKQYRKSGDERTLFAFILLLASLFVALGDNIFSNTPISIFLAVILGITNSEKRNNSSYRNQNQNFTDKYE